MCALWYNTHLIHINTEKLRQFIQSNLNSEGHNRASIAQFEQKPLPPSQILADVTALDEAARTFIAEMRSQGIPEEAIYDTLRTAGMLPEQSTTASGYQHTPTTEIGLQGSQAELLVAELLAAGRSPDEIMELLNGK